MQSMITTFLSSMRLRILFGLGVSGSPGRGGSSNLVTAGGSVERLCELSLDVWVSVTDESLGRVTVGGD